jgi:hypothetical protein
MSVAPPPTTYTATNDLNILKNIFVPQYQFDASDGYFKTTVNTNLPGNVYVGNATGSSTNYKVYVNGTPTMTLSDLQSWAYYIATSNINVNSNLVYNVSRLRFLGSSASSPYTIDATSGTINVSQYWLKGVALTLSGGLPAWATYRASANVTMSGYAISGVPAITMSGASIVSSQNGILAFSNVVRGVETVRIDASGVLGVGTTVTPSSFITLNVSGGGLFTAPIVLSTVNTGNIFNNAFFVQTVFKTSTTYDVRMGAVGGDSDLYLCTGNGIGNTTLNNSNRVKIDNVGNVLVMTGQFTVSDAAQVCTVGGVKLVNSNVTSLLSISIGSFSSISLTSTNQTTTFINKASGTVTINLPGTASQQGMYWKLKNATASAQTIARAGTGTFDASTPFTNLSAGSNATIVYSGAGSVYYVL